MDQEIQLADENEGQTKLALWSNPGDGTLGSLSRSRRVVETVEGMMGGPVSFSVCVQLCMALIRNVFIAPGDALPLEEPGQVPGGGRRLELAPGARCPCRLFSSENHAVSSVRGAQPLSNPCLGATAGLRILVQGFLPHAGHDDGLLRH